MSLDRSWKVNRVCGSLRHPTVLIVDAEAAKTKTKLLNRDDRVTHELYFGYTYPLADIPDDDQEPVSDAGST